MSRLSTRALWLLVPLFALAEVGAHGLQRSAVVPLGDWEAAGRFVRSQHREGDLIASAPAWTDPNLRLVLGDLIPLSMAGRADAGAYGRLWSLSIRDGRAPEAPSEPAGLTRSFGGVRVERWDLPPVRSGFDFVENLAQAVVRLGDRPCEFRRTGAPRGGGLGRAVLAPSERFVCDSRRGWLWVAPVVMEDLDLQPRRCVWQHAAGRTPVVVEFPRVPLLDEIVFRGSLYYEHERMRKGGPVTARLMVNDRPAGTFVHEDGDGTKAVVVPTAGLAGTTGSFRVQVTAPRPQHRSFCWSATTRRAKTP